MKLLPAGRAIVLVSQEAASGGPKHFGRENHLTDAFSADLGDPELPEKVTGASAYNWSSSSDRMGASGERLVHE